SGCSDRERATRAGSQVEAESSPEPKRHLPLNPRRSPSDRLTSSAWCNRSRAFGTSRSPSGVNIAFRPTRSNSKQPTDSSSSDIRFESEDTEIWIRCAATEKLAHVAAQ